MQTRRRRASSTWVRCFFSTWPSTPSLTPQKRLALILARGGHTGAWMTSPDRRRSPTTTTGRRRAARRSDLLWCARSALTELRLLAGLVEAGLLALDLAVVTGEEAGALELRAQVLVGLAERLGDAVAHGPGLRRDAAAVHVDLDVELAVGVRGLEGHLGDGFEDLAPEVGVDGAAVDDDRADARAEGDAGDAGLAFAGRPVGHCIRHALLLDLEHFGLLRLVRMLRASIDIELAAMGAPKLGVRQHAAHGVAHDLLGPAGLELGIRLALDAA